MRRTLLAPLSPLVLLIVCATLPATGQDQPTQVPPFGRQGQRTMPDIGQRKGPQDEQIARMEKEQEKRRNKERQASLKEDTDKLLELATQLKQYVDKSNENILSLDVMKKAEEIEKLAKQVEKKMRSECAAEA